jgi:uncharacterized protein YbjT (DUF2867 family)
MDSPILVTGATGNVGSAIVKQLITAGQPFIAANHDLVEAKEKLGSDTPLVWFDFEQPTSFSAFRGVKSLFLLRPPHISDVDTVIAPAIDAAKVCGVEHIVFLSIQGVERIKFVPHYKIEQAIAATGIRHTFLRCGFFMQNLSTTHRVEIQERGEIDVPAGRSKTSFIDVRDIAEVAALVLTQPEDKPSTLTLTGGEALDYDQVAAVLTDVLGKPIRYTNPSIPGFMLRQRQQGRTWGQLSVMTMLYTLTRLGNAASVSDDVQALLARPPRSFRQFAEDYRPAWQ